MWLQQTCQLHMSQQLMSEGMSRCLESWLNRERRQPNRRQACADSASRKGRACGAMPHLCQQSAAAGASGGKEHLARFVRCAVRIPRKHAQVRHALQAARAASPDKVGLMPQWTS